MGFLTVRERHIDEYLKVCLANGVQQVVILGAGFDSRAYRFEEFRRGVKVFEVDHPATQQAKLKQVAAHLRTCAATRHLRPDRFQHADAGATLAGMWL